MLKVNKYFARNQQISLPYLCALLIIHCCSIFLWDLVCDGHNRNPNNNERNHLVGDQLPPHRKCHRLPICFFTLTNMRKSPKTHVMMMMVMVIRSYDGDNCGDDCSDGQKSWCASSRTTQNPKVGATQVYLALYGVFDNIIWRYDGVIDDRMVWRSHGKMTGLYDQMLM